jgi:hypothetical protein
MVARLGNVLYWLGCILAGLFIVGGVAEWFGEARYRPDGYGIIIGFAVVAFIIWLIGRACRYVLSGV